MRSDMKDLIVEEPRTSGYETSRTYVRARHKPRLVEGEDDDGSYIEDRNARHGKMTRTTKHFGDHTMPLKRFLIKNVGRKWDDVWSEICEFADLRSIRGRHLREHVGFWVDQKVALEDGEPVTHRGYGGAWSLRPGDMYVHPETGILTRVPKVKRQRGCQVVNPDIHKDPNSREALLEKLDGIWYRITYLNTSQDSAYRSRRFGSVAQIRPSFFETALLIKTKKQLSRKELRNYRLSND